MIACGNCKGKHETVAEVRACCGVPIGRESSADAYRRQMASLEDGQRAADRIERAPFTGKVATPKMVEYVRSLAKNKSMDESAREEAMRILAEHDSAERPMAFGYARRFIESYKIAPVRVAVGSTLPSVVTEDGMYRDPESGAIFKVQWNRGSGDGRALYAKRLVLWVAGSKFSAPTPETAAAWDKDRDCVEFQYAPGAVRSIRPEWRMSIEEAKEFGALYGTCIRCGRDLTLEESIERGMGRICAEKI